MRRARGHAAKALRAKEPLLVEGDKRLLFLRGPSTSQVAVDAAKDLLLLKKPLVKALTRKNEVRPFEDPASIEFLCEKSDCAAFLYVSHNKKRPHNLVLGRIYNGHVYDMLELGVAGFTSLRDFRSSKKALGSPPCMLFAGPEWDASPDHALLRQMLLDVFGARDLTGITLQGLDHVLLAAVDGDTVRFRGYYMGFRRSDSRVPRVELTAMGPSLDLTLRRVQHSSAALEKEAMRIPAQLKPKKVKNVTHDEFGETIGRIHMERQDFSKLELKKTKSSKLLRKRAAPDAADEAAEEEEGEEGEDEEEGVGMAAAAAPPRAAAPAAAAGRSAKRARLAE